MTRTTYATRRDALKTMSLLAGCAAPAFAPVWAAAALTPAQVEGPFYPARPAADRDLDLTRIQGHTGIAAGDALFVRGQLTNLRGEPLAGATVDVWQANHYGRYRHRHDRHAAPLDEHFQGWGVVATDAQGRYEIKTIMPGPYPLAPLGRRGWRCRHIHFKLSHPRCRPLTTQMYFSGDPLLAADEELAKAPAALRHMLIAAAVAAREGLPVYGFDIVLADA